MENTLTTGPSKAMSVPENPRVFVGMPNQGTVSIETFRSVMKLGWAVAQQPLPDGRHIADLQFKDCETSALMQARYQLITDALATPGITHFLWIDTDIGFPPDALHRLLMHGKPVVAANYPMKTMPICPPTARTRAEGYPFGKFLVTTPTSSGLEEACLIGFGFCLIEIDVFRKIPEPWMSMPFTAARGEGTKPHFMGEDTTFCDTCHELGIPIYVDHDLSQEIVHVGRFSYKNEYVHVEG